MPVKLQIMALSLLLLLSLTGCGTRTGGDSASSASPAVSSAAAGASATAGAVSSGAASRLEPSGGAAASTPDIPDASDTSGSVDTSDAPESSENPGGHPESAAAAASTADIPDASESVDTSDAPESPENPGGHPESAAAAASTADAAGSAGQAEIPETQETSPDAPFAEAAGEYLFSSGAGAWGTTLTLAPDGSFTGSYHDSEMGDQGDGYPNGTVYVCTFSGTFAPPEKIDGYTWSTRLESLKYDPPDTETIEDEIRYITAEPLGLAGAEEIRIYLPGAPLDALPEGFLSWAAMFLYGYEGSTLPACGIYNATGDTAFVQNIYSG